MSVDAENGELCVTYIKGFPSLTAFIASDSEHSTAIYKRFDRLSSRNLLYYQSELADLEAKQDYLDRLDLQEGIDGAQERARNWRRLIKDANIPGSPAEEQLKLAMQIREKLKEYRAQISLFCNYGELIYHAQAKQSYSKAQYSHSGPHPSRHFAHFTIISITIRT